MYVFGNIIIAVASILDIILTILFWLIFVRALISWVSPDPYNSIVQFLYKVTEPLLQPIRRFMPRMAIDLSPLIAFLMIVFVRMAIINSLITFGHSLK